jgi:3-phenylpropionate/trans-cinnamate dioxygenase ferredoxin component
MSARGRKGLHRLGAADLGPRELRGYEAGGELVLVARVGARLCALSDWCNHAGCLLSQGAREEGAVICPCHDIAFDLITGRNLNAPELAGDQQVFEIEERGGALYVRIE